MSTINKKLFNYVLNQPRLLKFILKFSNFDKKSILQKGRNKLLAKCIEGIYSAGETLTSAELCIERLERKNIGVILNYATESGNNLNI